MKKIIMISILLLFLSFTAVQASDTYNATDDHSFDAVQNSINQNDVIKLDGTYTGSGKEIVVNKSVTIRGSSSNTILNAKSNSRVFNVQADDVVLENLEFVNGNPKYDTYEYGGAIYITGNNVKIINCRFSSNSAQYGGAIASLGENTTIIDCQFTSNLATSSGGAFELDGDNCYADGCTFKDNTAGHVGGSVSWVGANGKLLNSDFSSQNIAQAKSAQFGGAVIWMGVNGTLTHSTFTKNQAKKSGSAVYWKGENGTISHCDFANNTSPSDQALFGNPDYANYNYWGSNIYSAEDFIALKLIYYNSTFSAPNCWLETSSIRCSDLTTHNVINVKNGKYFKITLLDSKNQPLSTKSVTINLNGAKYTRTTDKNGIASIQVNIKNPGSYKVTVLFNGDNEYKSSSNTAKITVNKQKPALTVSTKTLKLKSKRKVIKVYLKDQFKRAMAKKVVKLTVNKKTYRAKTNSKGMASFKVTLKVKKRYSCTFSFAGDKYYKSVKKTAKIRVK